MKDSLKNKLLNGETEDIWEYINSKCTVNIIADIDYSAFVIERKSSQNEATIRYNQFELRPDYFAHELLHIKINCDGYLISKLIDELHWKFPVVMQTWDRDFRNLFGNIIEHEKMLNQYLELGFREDEFVGDYYEKKCSIEDVNYEMKMCFHPSIDSLKYITAKFFLIKGTINSSFNYVQELNLLSELAPKLYECLETFWNSISQIREPYEKEKQRIIVLTLLNNLEKIYSKV